MRSAFIVTINYSSHNKSKTDFSGHYSRMLIENFKFQKAIAVIPLGRILPLSAEQVCISKQHVVDTFISME